MAGKNCFSIAAGQSLCAAPSATDYTEIIPADRVAMGTDFQKIFRIHDKLFVGFSGLATDVQMLYRKLIFEHKLYQLREERVMKVETFVNLLSSFLVLKRPYWYICQSVIAGLGDDDKPCLYWMDSSGFANPAEDFVATMIGERSFSKASKTMYKAHMESVELQKIITEVLCKSMGHNCFSDWIGHVIVVTPSEAIESHFDAANVIGKQVMRTELSNAKEVEHEQFEEIEADLKKMSSKK